MVSTSSLKKLQQTEKIVFKCSENLFLSSSYLQNIFLKASYYQISFKKFSPVCLTLAENGFNFVTQKLAKNWRILFSNAHKIHFWAQDNFKIIFLEASYEKIFIIKVLNPLPHLSKKWFYLCHSKICKKEKNDSFKPSEHSFLNSR